MRSFNFWNICALAVALLTETIVGFPGSLWICLAQGTFVGGMLVGMWVRR